ncbi:MAG: alkaline shock response membrane anchor protein AmaP [Firmicutes bacterium]|nr:alkaline shock response membrane anchor protein AmaP [Bacillota bacterium]
MKSWGRTFFALLALLALIVGVLLVLIATGILRLQGIGLIELSRLAGSFTFFIAGIVIFIVGLLLLIFCLRKGEQVSAISQQTELGELSISYKTIESMILKASRSVKGIRDITAKTASTEKGLVIYIKAKAVPEKPIPELTLELQASVKDYVEKIGGTAVAEVKVLIENISSEPVN